MVAAPCAIYMQCWHAPNAIIIGAQFFQKNAPFFGNSDIYAANAPSRLGLSHAVVSTDFDKKNEHISEDQGFVLRFRCLMSLS